MLRGEDVVGAPNIDLMEHAASICLERSLVVIIESILTAARHESMLQRLSLKMTGASLFYANELTLAETSRRHVTRAKSVSFGNAKMGQCDHGWQPLPYGSEVGIDSSWTENAAMNRIVADIAPARATGR
jgi:hypothetical protein